MDDYQEKLRLAKKALDSGSYDKETIEYIFPELKESEDEEIRKHLISFLKDVMDFGKDVDFNKYYKSDCAGWIAWLEKQGEKTNPYSGISFEYNSHTWGMCARDNGVDILIDGKIKAFISLEKSFIHPQPTLTPKPTLETSKEEKIDNQNCAGHADKVEPKFKVGDWVIDKQGIVHQIANVIENVTNHTYGYDVVGGEYFNDNTEGVKLWTIQGAKEGDVLAFKDGISGVLLYKENTENFGVLSYCRIIRNSFIDKEESGWGSALLSPATKEQRVLLFQKMKEAGYEWDAEKKELKRIEQKTTWSEEDERILDRLIKHFDWGSDYRFDKNDCDEAQDWLKSLKERYI